MKCIKCGTELKSIMKENGMTIPDHVGFQCVNPECEIYNEQWTIGAHKDNQDWAVRHIRILESKNSILEQRVQMLESQIAEQSLIIDAISLVRQ